MSDSSPGTTSLPGAGAVPVTLSLPEAHRLAVAARALVTPFDSLVWEWRRLERLFGMAYTIDLYTPPARRVYGLYVCPFLLGDTRVARCDLKADRQRQILLLQSAFLEPEQEARRVARELAGELRQTQAWLALDRIEVAERGDLAAPLRQSVGHTAPGEALRVWPGAHDRRVPRPRYGSAYRLVISCSSPAAGGRKLAAA